MPVSPTFPGVYIQELPSGVHPIIGVPTSITAFIGRATRGPTNKQTVINNFGDFSLNFGGLDVNCPLGYAVQHFFQNGGSQGIIVRVANAATARKATVRADSLKLTALGEGVWGNNLRVRIDQHVKDTIPASDQDFLFNIWIYDTATKNTEVYRNVSVRKDDARYVKDVLKDQSSLVNVESDDDVQSTRPAANAELESPSDNPFDNNKPSYYYPAAGDGVDGDEIQDIDIQGDPLAKQGIYALEDADLFNILCIPPLARTTDVGSDTVGKAATYCVDKRAILLVDPDGSTNNVTSAIAAQQPLIGSIGQDSARNCAFFFPRLKIADPLKDNLLQPFVPCGAVAGVMARTDAQRGVWKSPAGLEASLSGVNQLTLKMTDSENGQLNPLGVNCLRNFPVYGNVVWGSRTMAGADRMASEWKYLAVRRTALFIEESLFRGTQWVVFEPNDEPLWAQIRLNVGAFMNTLFRKGAFQGKSPQQAYLVKCDSETTRQADINAGIVNILVGFAPLKPAEFVIISIQQLAGQIDT